MTWRIWIEIRGQRAGLWCTGGDMGMSWTNIQVGRDLGLTGQGAWSRRRIRELQNWAWLMTDGWDWGVECEWKLVWQGWGKGMRMNHVEWDGEQKEDGVTLEWIRLWWVKGGADTSAFTACLPALGGSTGWGFQPLFTCSLHTRRLPAKHLLPYPCWQSADAINYSISLNLLKAIWYIYGIQTGLSSIIDTMWQKMFWFLWFCSSPARCSKKYFPQTPFLHLHISN